MKWNDLTMKERSDLMSLFLKAGVGSLSDMKHIYDGTKDIIPMQTDDNGNLRDSITPATVSASLSRDEWNNLYAQGKVSLSQIPRKYQSWIEGQNSKFKADITKAMHNAGENYLIPAFLTAATLNPIIGRASDIASIGSQIATGNFTGAAIDAATAFLPEVLEKPITQFLRKRRFLKNIPKVPDFEGSESSVYIEGDRVFKIPDQGMAPNTKEEAKRIAKTFMDKRNSIPNQASLKYEGLVPSQTPKFDKNGNPLYYPVFSQEKMLPFSNNISEIEQEYIMKRLDDRMNPYGWTRQGSEYVHPSGKHVSDLKPENLATGNDGNIYIIDGDVWGYKNGGFVENPLKYKYPDGGDIEVYGGEIAPAVVKPSSMFVDLVTYPISRAYKISHSALFSNIPTNGTQSEIENFKPLRIDKRFDATYNLLTNNCSDYTGRFLENALHLKGLTKGITTPKGLSNKIRKYAYEGDINMVEYPSEGNGKSKYTVQNIEIPWYDYRKAEDIARQQLLEDLIQNNKQLSPKRISKLRERYNKDFPKLQYYIDDKGNVIHERNSF